MRPYDTATYRRARKRLKGQPCVKCGSTDNTTVDHIVPLALGGSNTVDNFQSMCAKHNYAKGGQLKHRLRRQGRRYRNNAY